MTSDMLYKDVGLLILILGHIKVEATSLHQISV